MPTRQPEAWRPRKANIGRATESVSRRSTRISELAPVRPPPLRFIAAERGSQAPAIITDWVFENAHDETSSLEFRIGLVRVRRQQAVAADLAFQEWLRPAWPENLDSEPPTPLMEFLG